MPILQEFNTDMNESYFFENDGQPYFVSAEALASVQSTIANSTHANETKETSQIKTLIIMENLKRDLALERVSVGDYRIQLKSIMHEFFEKNSFDVFQETRELQQFYKLINDYYNREEALTDVEDNS